MTSGLRERRRLCIVMILSISLLFLPLTFSANNINNNALAQSSYCELDSDYDPQWCIWEIQVENFPRCVEIFTEYNEMLASYPLPPVDVSNYCHLPEPPEPRQPLDCNQLGTCPTDQCQEVVPASLNWHDSHDWPRILFVDYVYVQGDLPTGGHDACPNIRHLHEGKCKPGFALDKNNICKPVPELAVELCAYEAQRDILVKLPRWIYEHFDLGGPFEWIGEMACRSSDIPIAHQYCFGDKNKPLCITIGPGKP